MEQVGYLGRPEPVHEPNLTVYPSSSLPVSATKEKVRSVYVRRRRTVPPLALAKPPEALRERKQGKSSGEHAVFAK
jgi:hypothetical protein